MEEYPYPTWIEVNLSIIENNVKNLIKHAGVPLMAVVKANGYGHGSVEASKAIISGGASYLSVARYCETIPLRNSQITNPILVFGMVMPEEVDEAIANDVTITLYSPEQVGFLAQRAATLGKVVTVHLKVDTGMGRLGVLPHEVLDLVRHVHALGNIHIEGVYSHFATADEPDHPLIRLQLQRFKEVMETLHAEGLQPRWVHIANSSALLYEKGTEFSMVRAGAAVYGILTRAGVPYPAHTLRHALTWKARLISVKVMPKGWGISYGQTYVTADEEVIGVVPIGYADGFRRMSGNEVLIEGQRMPVVGRVCMDQCMVRLPKKYPIGTEVVIIGEQGSESIYSEELAARWKTAEHDPTSALSLRIPRIYTRS